MLLMTSTLDELVAGAAALVGALELDVATVARGLIAVLAAVILLRILARVAWVVARIVAVLLVALVILALLSGSPTRLTDFAALREAAIEAVHGVIDRSVRRDLPSTDEPLPTWDDDPPSQQRL